MSKDNPQIGDRYYWCMFKVWCTITSIYKGMVYRVADNGDNGMWLLSDTIFRNEMLWPGERGCPADPKLILGAKVPQQNNELYCDCGGASRQSIMPISGEIFAVCVVCGKEKSNG